VKPLRQLPCPALQKDSSFEGSGFEHKTAKLLNEGNLKRGKRTYYWLGTTDQMTTKWWLHYIKMQKWKVSNAAHNLHLYMGSLQMVHKCVWYLCTRKLDILHHCNQLPVVQPGKSSWILVHCTTEKLNDY
jgi:hypothetical protein